MDDAAARFRGFLADTPHWLDLLAVVPAAYVARRDTEHPAFHGCVDWHSACHGVWALLAYQRATGDARYRTVADAILTPANIAAEASDLASRLDFEMPYGRAWFLRLAIEDRAAGGGERLTAMADAVARSLRDRYAAAPPDPFAREYENPAWAFASMLDYARAFGHADLEAFVAEQTRAHFLPALDRLPPAEEEESWPDFMAVSHVLTELILRAGAADWREIEAKVADRLLAMAPVTRPVRAHHHGLNLSRAWALFAIHEASGDARFLASYLDHMQSTLGRPSWWRGDYWAVGHWVPQLCLYALLRIRGRAERA